MFQFVKHDTSKNLVEVIKNKPEVMILLPDSFKNNSFTSLFPLELQEITLTYHVSVCSKHF